MELALSLQVGKLLGTLSTNLSTSTGINLSDALAITRGTQPAHRQAALKDI
jgi:hypothetical protein